MKVFDWTVLSCSTECGTRRFQRLSIWMKFQTLTIQRKVIQQDFLVIIIVRGYAQYKLVLCTNKLLLSVEEIFKKYYQSNERYWVMRVCVFFTFLILKFYLFFRALQRMKVFTNCPIWTDLAGIPLYRPCELELSPFHTRCQRSPGHPLEELVCRTGSAPSDTSWVFLGCSKRYIRNIITYLARKGTQSVKPQSNLY